MIALLVAALALQPPSASPALPTTIIVPASTPVHFVTESVIDSRTVRQGERFTIIVAEDVLLGDRMVLPKGTRAVGEIEAVGETGMFGKPGSLLLRPLFVEFGGQRINLDGAIKQRGKKQVGGAAVATVAVGALGLIITGKRAVLPAGSKLNGHIRNDVTLAWPAR